MSFVTAIANRFGLMTKSQVRAAIVGFQTAALSRLTNDWATGTLSADAQARNDLKTLIARCRDLRDNNDYGKAFVRMLKSNVLGHGGIHFKNRAKDPDMVLGGKLIPGKLDVFANKIIEDARYEWGKKENCTVEGNMTLCEVERVVLETTATDGAVLVRMVRGFDNPFKFALQLFEIDYIDFELNKKLGNGHEIRMGVELNEWKRPVAYYLLKYNPNDSYYGLERWGLRHTVLPARDVIHPFIRYRSKQTHGIPWMVTPAQRLKMLGGYEEAELVASRLGACKSIWLEQTGDQTYNGPDDGMGNKLMDAEPGGAEILPAGLKPNFWDPAHPNSNYPQVVKAWLRGVAAGLGTSYHTLANDMEAVNFASGMIGLGEERDAWKGIQYWIIEDFEEPLHTNWLEMAILSGVVPLPMSKFAKFNAPYFSGRRWPFVNPAVEVGAIEIELKQRLTSITRVLAERNIDRDELFQEIEEERKELERRKILPEDVMTALADIEAAEQQAQQQDGRAPKAA